MSSHLKIIPDMAYMEIFRNIIDKYLSEITSSFHGMLTSSAEEGLEKAFWRAATKIAGNTLKKMQLEILVHDSFLSINDLNLYPAKQKEEAALVLKEQLERKEQILPPPLFHVIHARFRLLADAFSEMLENIFHHSTQISDVLFGGQVFTRIENIDAGAGDYHNFARSAAIIETDIGKMVYKPRNCLADIRTGYFAHKYFPESVRIPKCYTDGSSFGVCEYLRSDPDRADFDSKKWFYSLGELTVLVLLLGSSDMHYENIISASGIPAIIDLETILTPLLESDPGQISPDNRNTRFSDEIRLSVWPSAILPRTINGVQSSILFQPPVTVLEYSNEYFEGLETAYRRCLIKKEELKKDVLELFSDVPVRLVTRNTMNYGDLLIQLYKSRNLSSEEAWTAFSDRLEKALMYDDGFYQWINRREASSILRGDIPYFYTLGNSHDIYDDKSICRGMIRRTGIENSLLRIDMMNEQELVFETKLIREAFEAESVDIRQDDKTISVFKEKNIPAPSSEVLSAVDAADEAVRIMKEIHHRMIKAPNGSIGWVGSHGHHQSLEIMPAGMFTGTAGIGVFSAAIASACVSHDVQELAVECEQTAVLDMKLAFEDLKAFNSHSDMEQAYSYNLGEASGIAGLLRCLCLMNRYSGCDIYRYLIRQILDLLEMCDISCITDTDRIQGLSGIICVLCDYTELHGTSQGKKLIASFSERLLELKQFRADGFTLWKTGSETHIISGAGHGMAGIGTALFSAGNLLRDRRFLNASLEAWEYEKQAYNEKLGSWPDNRFWPPQSYMHGYCSGAPGIGIMIQKIKNSICASESDIELSISEICDRCEKLAEKSVSSLPLLHRDHLCCGNSAVAEYYLSLGKKEEAGKILKTIFLRKEKAGNYILSHPGYLKKSDMSLFYGITGIGYEMLRYAFPEQIFSII